MVIRNIWAVGRNYLEHAKEMNASASAIKANAPLIFLKAGSCASVNSTVITLPWWAETVHHEVELCLKLNPQLRVLEGAVALDLTERNQQELAKKSGLPWTLAKSFDGACAVSSFFQVPGLAACQNLQLRLWVNDQLRQQASTSEMIFSCQEILDYLFQRFPICGGDLILTGTPSGVGPLHHGDVVKAEIKNEIVHIWKVDKQSPPPDETKK